MYPGERLNSITHLVGTVFATAAAAVLITLASLHADPWKIVSSSIYGATLILLYTSSMLYHSFRGAAKQVFHVFDHCAIYLLIAGTYTPLALVTMRRDAGWWLFAIVWSLALAGIAKDAIYPNRFRVVSVALHVIMGWSVVAALPPLVRALPPAALAWLIVGGVIYTAGIAFYALSKRVPYSHGVWHLFVLGGSVSHYLMIAIWIVGVPRVVAAS